MGQEATWQWILGMTQRPLIRGTHGSRASICVRGAVQGVGFRPFIYRLAHQLHLAGWVCSSPSGVRIEVEGAPDSIADFLVRMERDRPPVSIIQKLEVRYGEPAGLPAFQIRESEVEGTKDCLILPDLATCPDCLRELFDPRNRRYFYPFTNCTHCGPRFTITRSLPYDRASTSMNLFPLCEQCMAEYGNPMDRRFHDQVNACPTCGPWVELWDPRGEMRFRHRDAIVEAADAIDRGKIVAVKAMGGYHLVCGAGYSEAVKRLRAGKRRRDKPLALMFPDVEAIRRQCAVDEEEEECLTSSAAPIVLLPRLPEREVAAVRHQVCEAVAPSTPNLGVMLPCTPLQHLLMDLLRMPVVATSGNLSDEPICIDEIEALHRLGGVADLFLVHNRPILRQADDSVVRFMSGRATVFRRARGYAPLPISIPAVGDSDSLLAVGAQQKCAVALGWRRQVFVGQHLGDLEDARSMEAFLRSVDDLQGLYGVRAARLACDRHPDYLSGGFARKSPLPRHEVQHHHAHILACLADNDLEPPVTGISWDGTGYGEDGMIWGGEILRVESGAWSRVGHLRPFPLPGGEAAVKEPRRSAVGLLYEMLGEDWIHWDSLAPLKAFPARERRQLAVLMQRRIQAPKTTSAGRLFDAVAALMHLRQCCNFEGQAAMELEFAAGKCHTRESYPFGIQEGGASSRGSSHPLILDWEPMVRTLIEDWRRKVPVAIMAARFHHTLVEMIVAMARHVGLPRVALSGGCFQNRLLTEQAIDRLRQEGFKPYWHHRIPPNDGGISIGQIVAATTFPPGKEAAAAWV